LTQAASKQYLRDEILGASPQKLVVLLYDGAIKNLEEAKRHISDEDPYSYTLHYTKAEAIIAELTGAVKPKMNPEVGINLLRLYDYMYQALLESHSKRDGEQLSQVISMLREMRATWASAIEKAQDEPELALTTGETETAPQPPRRPSLSFEA
jgi:flagellar protein FliS